jgi:hypothetical protein
MESSGQEVVRKVGISDMDILLGFINDEKGMDPLAFLKQSAHEPVRWLPLFYYANLTGLNRESLIDELKRFDGSKPGTIRHMQQRLMGSARALVSNLGSGPLGILESVSKGAFPDVGDLRGARQFAMALTGLTELGTFKPHLLRAVLSRIIDLYEKHSHDSAIGSSMRRSAARVDELLYGQKLLERWATSSDINEPPRVKQIRRVQT